MIQGGCFFTKNKLNAMQTAFLHFVFILSPVFYLGAQSTLFSEPRALNLESPDGPYRIMHPFEIQFGPDEKLWVSSKAGFINLVDPHTGERSLLADLSDLVHFTRFYDNQGGTRRVAQDGLLGVALHPELGTGTDNDWVYVAYVYDADPGSGLDRKGRIVRYRYTEAGGKAFLGNPLTLIEGLPGSNDHNAGRLIFGGDDKLYYSVGDQGANQGSNRCNPNRAQDLPTQQEIADENYDAYQGKILRIDLDGSIPEDNPGIEGTKSHIYSYGHRNPQGLVFERDKEGHIPENAQLYSNEHGHRTDDELNLILPGKNYGWPFVSGFKDDIGYSYFNWSSSSNCPNSSTNACNPPVDAVEVKESAFSEPNFQEPLMSFFVDPNPTCGSFLDFSTIAPSSMDYYYHSNAIPGWENSLLITTLKRGTVYRLQLNEAGDQVVGQMEEYFKAVDRYRDMAISRDGLRFYVLTDSLGSTSFAAGDNNQALVHRGGILEFTYEGPLVATDEKSSATNPLKLSPNPANRTVRLQWESISKQIPITYVIKDLNGRLVRTVKSSDTQVSIPLDGIAPGLYIVTCWNAASQLVATKKLVVQ